MKRNILYKLVEKTGQNISYLFAIRNSLSSYGNRIKLSKKELYRLHDKGVINCSIGIQRNHCFPAGKYIDIYTNADSVDVIIVYKKRVSMEHMSDRATSGIDVYIKSDSWNWKTCIVPQNSWQMCLKQNINFENPKNEYIRFYFPPFSEIEEFELVVKEDFEIKILDDNNDLAVVYGSSISQGCAASRPGLSYINILSRIINNKTLNFGFSESAHAEETIIKYIAALNASIYIIEYDHNSSIEELNERHLKVYKNLREFSPKSIIIFLSRLSGGLSIPVDDELLRIEIILKTLEVAKESNDDNVFFINGSKLIKDNKELYFTDDRHPNDHGMYVIANELAMYLKTKE